MSLRTVIPQPSPSLSVELARRGWNPARYPEHYLLLGPSEAEVQAAVVLELQSLGWRPIVIDAGAKMLRGRAVGALRQAGASHLAGSLRGRVGAGEAGLSDVVAVDLNGRAAFIEVKAPARYAAGKRGRLVIARAAGSASDAQAAFLYEMAARGCAAGVAWSPGDAREIVGGIERWGGEVYVVGAPAIAPRLRRPR